MELSRRSRRQGYLVSSVHLSDTIITNPLAILPGPFYFVSSRIAWDGLLPDYSARFYDYTSAAAFNTTLHFTSSDPDTPADGILLYYYLYDTARTVSTRLSPV